MTKKDNEKIDELVMLVSSNHVELLKMVADIRVDVANIKGRVFVYGGIIAAAVSGAIGMLAKFLQP